MEDVVAQRNDLDWIGWDVVKYSRSSSAMFSSDGVFRNGGWYKRKIFPLTKNGWNVPNSIGQRNA